MCLGTVDFKFPDTGRVEFTHVEVVSVVRQGDVMWGNELLKPSQQNTALQQRQEERLRAKEEWHYQVIRATSYVNVTYVTVYASN